MKLKKQLASLAVLGMMSLAAASSAFASGVGYVDPNVLMQSHKDFPKVTAQMNTAIKDARDKWNNQAPKLKNDQEREKLAQQLNENLNQLEVKLLTPIEKDVESKIEQVRKDKGLDCIVVKGAIISGAESATDQTNAVKTLLSK